MTRLVWAAVSIAGAAALLFTIYFSPTRARRLTPR